MIPSQGMRAPRNRILVSALGLVAVVVLVAGAVLLINRNSGPVAATNSTHPIAAGSFHALAIKSDGTVVAWGSNTKGQTNVPAGLKDVTSVAAGRYHSIALQADGTVVAWATISMGRRTCQPACQT
jgi:protein-S-isoprenylcysteine O-methyltransferase Ste14